jgi:guanylate cyclase
LALEVRIGIDTGPVVAGVIGRAKFIYDLWGDTVNTASRMESHAMPGTIQVTPRAYEQLREGYELQPRGTIELKGKGPMTTFLLLGRRAEQAGPAANDLRDRAARSH